MNLIASISKRFYLSFLVVFVIVLTITESYGQGLQEDKLSNVIPASPDVTEFQKYIDYPVSHTSGIPDISIPLYQINSGSLSLPITLSYHSSGFKVDEQSGSFGLGWVLNAGGMVSRKIVNKPDEWVQYPYPYKNPFDLNQENADDFFYIGNMHNDGETQIYNGTDSEYDVFYYNVGSVSGRFYLAGNGNNKRKPVVIPYEPISIKSNTADFNTNIEYFEITDKSGTIYRFGKSSIDGSSTIEEINNLTTAWLLREIYSADRASSIQFIYTPVQKIQTHRSDMWEVKDYRHDYRIYTYEQQDCYNTANSINHSIVSKRIEHTNSYYYSQKLKEIKFIGGRVQFDQNIIRIKNELGHTIKKLELEQAQFENLQSQSGNYMKLSSISSIDTITNKREKHEFTYNESTNLPLFEALYITTGVDYWGYYNGKTNNSSLVPKFQLGSDYMYIYTTSNNDRDADEEFMKTFILTKIKYPTGGTTEFEYETNKANNINIGGLRIKKIISKPDVTTTAPIIKKYTYGVSEDGNGLLLQDPSDIHNYLTTSVYDYICPYFPESIGQAYRVRTISSDLNDGGDLNSGSPVFYSEVAEYNESIAGITNGKTIYKYERPKILNYVLGTNAFRFSYEEWKTNHLLSKTDYSRIGETYAPIKSEEYGYFIRDDSVLKCTKVALMKYGGSTVYEMWSWYQPGKVWSEEAYLWQSPDSPQPVYWGAGEVYNILEYEYKTGVKLLDTITTTLYTPSGNIVTSKIYTYGVNHNEPLTITTMNSRGETQIVSNKYPHDFKTEQPYTDMVNIKHIWSPIVGQSTYKDNMGNFLKSAKTNYDFWNGYAWVTSSTNQILPKSVETKYLSNTSETKIMFNKYDSKSNLLEQQKANDIPISYIFGYNFIYPIAETKNSTTSECGYTGFENNETNSFPIVLPGAGGIINDPFTGKKAVLVSSQLGPGASFTIGDNAQYHSGYKASVWVKGSNSAYLKIAVVGYESVNSTAQNSENVNEWHLIEVELPRIKIEPYFSPKLQINASIGCNGGDPATFDDLRFYPMDAQMTTYTYDPLIGVTSVSDVNNKPITYEYDGFGRLILTRDFLGEILKKYDYNYKH